MLSLVSWVYQKIVQKCNRLTIIQGTNQPDQPISIPSRDDLRGIMHCPDKSFGIAS